ENHRRGESSRHAPRQAHHRPRHRARPGRRQGGRAGGDRGAARLRQLSRQVMILREVFEQSVALGPNREALVTQSGRFSYGGLFSRSLGAAGLLQAMGLKKGDHIGILMGNDEHWLALFYGAALAGLVTVPVNTRFKAAEIEFCVKQSDCKALFYVDRFLKQ